CWLERMIVTKINEEIEHHHKQDAANQPQRQIAFRPLHLAGHERNVVPTVVGPQRSQHRRPKTSDPSAGYGHAFAYSTNVCQAEISPMSTGIDEGANTDANYEQDFQRSKKRREVSADLHCGTVDQSGNRDC